MNERDQRLERHKSIERRRGGCRVAASNDMARCTWEGGAGRRRVGR